MKIIFFILLIIISSQVYSQSLSEIKKDSVVKIKNSDLSLIYYKKNTSVWDHNVGYPVLEPTKNKFFYLQSAGFLVEVDYKKQEFYALVIDPITKGYRHFYFAENEFNADIVESKDLNNVGEYLKIEGYFYNKSLEQVDSLNEYNIVGKVNMHFNKQNLFITDYKQFYELSNQIPTVIQSIEFPGQDSIFEGQTSYYPFETKNTINNSGIFNFKTNSWVLSRQYFHLFNTDNKVLVNKVLIKSGWYNTSDYPYSLYTINKTSISELKTGIKTRNPNHITCFNSFDSIVDITATNFSIIYGDNKMALVHTKENKFVINPTKNLIVYAKTPDMVFDIDFLTNSISAVVKNKKTGNYYSKLIAYGKLNAHLYEDYTQKLFFIDSLIFDENFNQKDEYSSVNTHSKNQFKIEVDKNNLFITDNQQSSKGLIAMSSEIYPLQDSISNFNEAYAGYFSPGHQRSGVYNNIKKRWILPQQYFQVHSINNYILASTELDEKNILLDSNIFYSLFKLNDNKVSLIKNNIITNDIEILNLISNYDSITPIKKTNYFITYKNDKQGLTKFKLFDTYFDDFTLTNIEFNYLPEYVNNKVLNSENDFIYFYHAAQTALVKKDGYYNIVTQIDDLNKPIIDSLKISDKVIYNEAKLSTKYPHLSIPTDVDDLSPKLLDFTQINDSILIIQNVIYEDGQKTYITSIEFPGEDSLDYNGDVIYYEYPGQYNSGVYNLKQNKWITKQTYNDIVVLTKGLLLLNNPILNDDGIIETFDNYSMIDYSGKIILENISINDLNNEPLIKYLTLPSEKITKYHLQRFSNINIPDSIKNTEKAYYIKNDSNKIKKVNVKLFTEHAVTQTEYHDYIYKNDYFDITFSINHGINKVIFNSKDSAQTFIFNDSNFRISILNKYTKLGFSNFNKKYEATIVVNNKEIANISLTKKIKSYDVNNNDVYKLIISKQESEIIVNLNPEKGRFEQYFSPSILTYDDDKIKYYEWGQEQSHIWRYTNQYWEIISPFYASIEKTNLGYICKSGSYSFSDIYDDNNEVVSSFIILDNFLKPISYLDYYNFYKVKNMGFGIKICLKETQYPEDELYFLIDYTGKVLCDALYNDFTIKSGVIYGTLESFSEKIKL